MSLASDHRSALQILERTQPLDLLITGVVMPGLILSFQQDGLAAPKVDVGRGEVGDGLVVSQVVVVGDEGGDLGLEIAWKIVVLQQDPVLERLVPALDLALGLGMEGGTADGLCPNP